MEQIIGKQVYCELYTLDLTHFILFLYFKAKFICYNLFFNGNKSFHTEMYACKDAISRETRTFAYQAIGMLAQRMPQLFRYIFT